MRHRARVQAEPLRRPLLVTSAAETPSSKIAPKAAQVDSSTTW